MGEREGWRSSDEPYHKAPCVAGIQVYPDNWGVLNSRAVLSDLHS